MASNISVKDSAGAAQVVKTTDTAAVHTPHQNIDAIAAGDNNIGNVDVVTMPSVAVTNAGTFATQAALTAGTNTNEIVGDVAHDIPITGNPITIGGVASAAAPTAVSLDQDAVRAWFLLNGAQATVLTAAGALVGGDAANGLDVDVTRLPALVAGSAAIGKLAANSGVDIGDVDVTSVNAFAAHDAAVAGVPLVVAGAAAALADSAPANRVNAAGDATRLATDLDGAAFVHPHGPQIWSYHANGSTALSAASVHAAPGAGLSLYVTDIIVSSGAATAMNALFQEGAGTVLGPYYLEAVAGRGLVLRFQTPKKITANTALTVTTSAAIAHSVDVTGYTAPG